MIFCTIRHDTEFYIILEKLAKLRFKHRLGVLVGTATLEFSGDVASSMPDRLEILLRSVNI